MNHVLPVDIQQRIDAQIASGLFADETAVLREALASLERRQHSLSQIREQIAAAEADVLAGRVAPFDRDEVKRRIRERLDAREMRE